MPYMDPTVYRSPGMQAYAHPQALDIARRSPVATPNDLIRASYFEDDYDRHRFRSMSPYHRDGFYGDFRFSGHSDLIRQHGSRTLFLVTS